MVKWIRLKTTTATQNVYFVANISLFLFTLFVQVWTLTPLPLSKNETMLIIYDHTMATTHDDLS